MVLGLELVLDVELVLELVLGLGGQTRPPPRSPPHRRVRMSRMALACARRWMKLWRGRMVEQIQSSERQMKLLEVRQMRLLGCFQRRDQIEWCIGSCSWTRQQA